MKKTSAITAVLATSALLGATAVQAGDNPFSATPMAGGYQLAQADTKPMDGKMMEGKPMDGKAADAKCGAERKAGKKADGSCGGKKADGSCGGKKSDASCGAAKKKADASCGASKK